MNSDIKISDYDYELPEKRIAKFPLERREDSKLLVSRSGVISERMFRDVGMELPEGALLVFNNTRVVRARIIMHKLSGARIEVFCLEPHEPADYERAFAVKRACEWRCIVGNSKKWKDGPLEIRFEHDSGEVFLRAMRVQASGVACAAGESGSAGEHGVSGSTGEQIIRFEWNAEMTFGQLLEHLGRVPIPPYLGRDSEELDNSRYQTVYSRFEGSVAAPTAGLHFSEGLIESLREGGVAFDEVTLHVGAGTFLPVKSDSVTGHQMHTEHFDVTLATLDNIMAHRGSVVAVGTTTVRTLESLAALGWRVMQSGSPDAARPVGQWELYDIPAERTGEELLGALAAWMRANGAVVGKSDVGCGLDGVGTDVDAIHLRLKASTQIMIMPGFKFRVADMIVTNFHQPKSTLLLLVSAFVGEHWREIYRHAMDNGFRFLSYGDSSLLVR